MKIDDFVSMRSTLVPNVPQMGLAAACETKQN